MDRCTDCPKTVGYPYEDKCPVCGGNAIVEYVEPSIIWKCSNCGGVVGDGFWSNCARDSGAYKVSLSSGRYSREQIILISKLFCSNVIEVYTKISREPIQRSFTLPEAVSVSKKLKATGIAFDISPKIEYSRIFVCHN